MVNQLKEIVIWSFTLSLVASYFACFGYYSFFQIDISTFLSIEDLTTIFAKWIWLSALPILSIIYFGYTFFNRIETEKSFWDGRLGKTMFKKRAVLVLPILITIIVGSVLYKPVRDVIAATFGIVTLLVILITALIFMFTNFIKKKQVTEITFIDWIGLLATSFIFIFVIPLICGLIAAANMTPDNIKVQFDTDEILNTADYSNIVYIGKTSDYFFLYDKTTKHTTAYSMDKVKKFEVIKTLPDISKEYFGKSSNAAFSYDNRVVSENGIAKSRVLCFVDT